ncbi:hypothetical protein QR680_013123 [Steinernema hermaphroditum]|uniref:Phospholipid-transporting ATPase n=1 Tax=Steinernema hermaphroditum TaxID=289476 RepID=A0AA39I6T1_9BILA|nr:hypothetical protein QR680_013123 [Steinernema hermaphroditum]
MTSQRAQKTHRRTSTQWNPPSRPVLDRFASISLPTLFSPGDDYPEKDRLIQPNIHEPDVPRYRLQNYRIYPHNDISTTKYNLFTFIPLNLYYQLKRVANIYLLLIAGLQFIPALHIASKYVGLIPISFVMFLTALKDAYEDFRRHRLDQKINHTRCHVWDSNEGRFRKMRWENIIVGDVVHLSNDETIPADILLIKSSDPEGQVFVETANLDGETNKKQLGVLPGCRRFCAKKFDAEQFNATVFCGHPTKEIQKISGRVEYADGSKDSIRKGNVMLRGCQVRDTRYVDGIVLYAGKDTKAMLNNGNAKNKRSSLEAHTNRFVLFCIAILVVITAISMGFYLTTPKKLGVPYWPDALQHFSVVDALLNFVSLAINFQVLIPISLYISIEVIRGAQLWMMSLDVSMYHLEQDRNFVYHSLNIPEELGQIKYVLSDKTGTLTENRMLFKHCSIAGERFPPDVVPVGGESEKSPRTSRRLQEMMSAGVPPDSAIQSFFFALAVCNTVFVNKQQAVDTVDDGYFEKGGDSDKDAPFRVGNSVFYDSAPTPASTPCDHSHPATDITLELGEQTGAIKRTPTW